MTTFTVGQRVRRKQSGKLLEILRVDRDTVKAKHVDPQYSNIAPGLYHHSEVEPADQPPLPKEPTSIKVKRGDRVILHASNAMGTIQSKAHSDLEYESPVFMVSFRSDLTYRCGRSEIDLIDDKLNIIGKGLPFEWTEGE